MPQKKRLRPRCEYGVTWNNELTGESGFFQCGGAGTSPSQMRSEPGAHPPSPDEVGEDGWPVPARGWTIKDTYRPAKPRSYRMRRSRI